ncbi:DUF3800 domain-containing protein [Flexivirga caeni]|uniref:DUF3800 domain-containing protein n=1 Tax=Flexivirga caeni TaxID=2294115 RepID=UPI0011CDE4C5|nr:DUF3800 domain-containing protein [Flexivirga caeni]
MSYSSVGPVQLTSPIVAWLDESGSNSALDPNTYMLAAAICRAENVETARAAMSEASLKGQRKIHWRDDNDKRHRAVIEVVAGLQVEHLVVVRSRPTNSADSPERRRRKCLERILFELTSMDVGHAIMESRGPADDRRDRAMLDHLRRTRALPATIRLDHAPGPSDPMLWIADAVCGAVSESRWDNAFCYEQLAGKIELVEI